MSLLNEISRSEDARIAEFPVVAHKVFLAHAAVCPLPARVARAMAEHGVRASMEGQFEYLHREAEMGARKLAAELIGATSDEIAFVASTSAGLSMIAQGLEWRPGDRVLIPDRDFPANLHPWLALRSRGVEVRTIPRRVDGSITIDDIEPRLDDRTRLVSLSSAHFGVGTPIDIPSIGQFLHSKGILFCVDAIQTLGAHPLETTHVDFLVADAHKWLLGPQGIGILFVRSDLQEILKPILVGWKSVVSSKDFSNREMVLAPSAKRYEPGSLNSSGVCGLHAALGILLESGIQEISQRICFLRKRMENGLREQGHVVLGRVDEPDPTGIVSFRPRTGNIEMLARSLDEEGFVLSSRTDILGDACIRVSPHFYNTTEEIDRLIDRL